MKFTLIDANDEPRTLLLKTLTLDAALKKWVRVAESAKQRWSGIV